MRLKWPIADIVGLKKQKAFLSKLTDIHAWPGGIFNNHSEGRLALHVS